MGLVSDLRIIYHMVFARFGGDSHGARLEAFYRHQAGAYDDFRRRRLRTTTPLTDVHADTLAAEHTESRLDEAEPIWAALAGLPAHYRVPLLLQGYAGYPLSEIARTLGWKEGTVKSRLHRARAQFQKLYVV